MADSSDTEVPSLETLARRYLELWQDQWAALAVDPEVAENFARLFQILGQGASLIAPFTPFGPAASYQRAQSHDFTYTQASAAPPGAATARFAHGGDVDDPAQLSRRLAALEKRLDALESRGSGPSRRTSSTTRRRRS